ncbi:MAG: PRC-barrel domain-containing protein [Puniceicoccaceae bacterium]
MEATDGEIGECKDVLFYDRSGRIGYFVVRTGHWFSHRKVLIAPDGIDARKARDMAPGKGPAVPTSLSRRKIEESPPYESDRPVSDEYQERLAAHYGWPQTVGTGGFVAPSMLASETIAGRVQSGPDPSDVERKDSDNLRSARDILGYKVFSQESAAIGEVSDVVLDPKLSELPYLRIKESDLLRAKNILLPWERLTEFDLGSAHVRTTVGATILENAPEAPDAEEFSDSSVERAIRNYFDS